GRVLSLVDPRVGDADRCDSARVHDDCRAVSRSLERSVERQGTRGCLPVYLPVDRFHRPRRVFSGSNDLQPPERKVSCVNIAGLSGGCGSAGASTRVSLPALPDAPIEELISPVIQGKCFFKWGGVWEG